MQLKLAERQWKNNIERLNVV